MLYPPRRQQSFDSLSETIGALPLTGPETRCRPCRACNRGQTCPAGKREGRNGWRPLVKLRPADCARGAAGSCRQPGRGRQRSARAAVLYSWMRPPSRSCRMTWRSWLIGWGSGCSGIHLAGPTQVRRPLEGGPGPRRRNNSASSSGFDILSPQAPDLTLSRAAEFAPWPSAGRSSPCYPKWVG